MSVPGFRKGHVPRAVVLNRLGKDYVLSETLRDHLGDWYGEAVEEAKVDPVSQPDIDFDEFNDDGAFAFTAKVQVRPTPVLGQYKGLRVPQRSVAVTEAQADAQLALLQERRQSRPVEAVRARGTTSSSSTLRAPATARPSTARRPRTT
jgi:trigger factor